MKGDCRLKTIEFDRTLERAVYHEVGHAWAYIKSGVDIAEVCLDAGGGFSGHVLTRPPFVVDITDRMSVIYAMWILLAGCVAEELHFGERLDDLEGDRLAAKELYRSAMISEIFLPHGVSRKERRAARSKLGSLPNKCDRYLLVAENTLRDAFARDWDYLEAIASRLLGKGRLTGEEIEQLLEQLETIGC